MVVRINTPDIPNPGSEHMVPHEVSRDVSLEATRTAGRLSEIPVEPRYIACIGDSIGLGMAQAMRINGIFGVESTHLVESTNGRRSVRDQLNSVDPKKTPYLIIQGGTNDLGGDPGAVARNLIEIYQAALRMGFKKVTLVTITPLNGDLGRKADQVNQILLKAAADGKINLFDLNAALRSNPAFRLAGDGVHPANYKPVGEIMLAYLRSNGGSMTDVNTDVLAGLGTGETGTTPEQYAELERQHAAGLLHQNYLGMTEKIDENTARQDFEKIQGASIADIRFNSRLLKPPAENETLDDRIAKLKEETARRIRVYTDEKNGEWYRLNYQKVGGQEHEQKIGLGDILLDPSIKHVLVKETDGTVTYAERGVYNGRVGFGTNGKYLATFTGDKFRIVTNEELSKADYEKEMKTEDDARTADQETFRVETTRSVKSSKINQMMNTALEEVRNANPSATEVELYRLAAKLAEEKAQKAATPEEKEDWMLVKKACEDNIEAMNVCPEFNMELYKKKICAVESGGGNYAARNDQHTSNKRVAAFGKYQFIAGTAGMFGAVIDPYNEESIQAFLRDKALQERVMTNFTLHNLKIYMSHSQGERDVLARNGHDVYHCLAAMHFSGGGNIKWARGTIGNVSDWLGGSQTAYFATMDKIAKV